jgi:hypothetical protein
MGARQPDRMQLPTPEPAASPPGIPPVSPSNNAGVHTPEIDSVLPRYVFNHIPILSMEFFNLDAYTMDHKHNQDLIPYLLTDDRPCTGLYTVCCVIMQLTCILQMTAAY